MGLLINIIKDLYFSRKPAISCEDSSIKRVLNVGGGSKSIAISSHYSGWQHDLLDIDPRGEPDIVCDARKLKSLPGGRYDAIYCSHNLEHYYRHDGLAVVQGFLHMLRDDGFAEIRVPDVTQVINVLRDRGLELDDVLYESPAGPISAHDVIYGLQSQIESSGQDFYAHKTGFTPKSIAKLLSDGGFLKVFLSTDDWLEVRAFAFRSEPSDEQYVLLGLSGLRTANTPG